MASISELRRAGEAERIDAIRAIVDHVAARIENRDITDPEAENLIADIRFQVSLLIPDQMDTYDLIYGARFIRLLEQFPPLIQPRKSL